MSEFSSHDRCISNDHLESLTTDKRHSSSSSSSTIRSTIVKCNCNRWWHVQLLSIKMYICVYVKCVNNVYTQNPVKQNTFASACSHRRRHRRRVHGLFVYYFCSSKVKSAANLRFIKNEVMVVKGVLVREKKGIVIIMIARRVQWLDPYNNKYYIYFFIRAQNYVYNIVYVYMHNILKYNVQRVAWIERKFTYDDDVWWVQVEIFSHLIYIYIYNLYYNRYRRIERTIITLSWN